MRNIRSNVGQGCRKVRQVMMSTGYCLLASAMLGAGPTVVHAQFKNPLGDGVTLFEFLIKILNVVVFVLFPVVVLMIVYTGFLFVVAQGNESKITQARTALFWTVIGVLVLLGSKALALAICETVKAIDTTATLTCEG